MVRPINAHGNLLMVIDTQMAATGGAGAKPLLGSANTMALPVVEFPRVGYKIRMVFARESTYPKEIFEF